MDSIILSEFCPFKSFPLSQTTNKVFSDTFVSMEESSGLDIVNLLLMTLQLGSIQEFHRALIARKWLQPCVCEIVTFQMTPSVE